MTKISPYFFILLLIVIFPQILLAAEDLGHVAVNVYQPVSILGDFVHTACFVIGGAFIFTSIIKYFEYRRSPLMTPLSTVVFLVVAGLVLIILPFLAYFTDNGLPFTLMNQSN